MAKNSRDPYRATPAVTRSLNFLRPNPTDRDISLTHILKISCLWVNSNRIKGS